MIYTCIYIHVPVHRLKLSHCSPQNTWKEREGEGEREREDRKSREEKKKETDRQRDHVQYYIHVHIITYINTPGQGPPHKWCRSGPVDCLCRRQSRK